MISGFPALRVVLYCVLVVFSIILLGLCAARLHYTLNLSPYDPLDNGRPFYDPVVAELLFSSIMTILWGVYMAVAINRRIARFPVRTLFHELIGLSILWLFWIVGAGVASVSKFNSDTVTYWGSLLWCQEYEACRVLTTLVAFVWLGWITITLIMGLNVLFIMANGSEALRDDVHGRWSGDTSPASPVHREIEILSSGEPVMVNSMPI
ncbi:hypothetical protein FISHEDRAFT_44814 [Fistulina hepatica ATCC 64428]|uniref:MARVEL domain-containing protein n=1 Tax=Fistulina hepatica ATCC 64428 TaxID=1128425 RepID=A0A0D7AA46_9AGAR|nr:hypothetical protein FISHEDRAFT_44814 [Fistulina hepatica ATCC 64428]